MAKITIVGLGPGAAVDLTLRAVDALKSAGRIIARTGRHPALDELPALYPGLPVVDTCDDLYEGHAQFADVYVAIVERVLAAARKGGHIVYAVPGHPWVGEQTTRLLLEAVQNDTDSSTEIEIIGGMSFVEPSFAAAQVDLMDGAQIVDAMLLVQQYAPKVEVGLPLLVAQVYARWLASDLKLTLLTLYPADHPVKIIRNAGSANEVVRLLPLHLLDGDDHFDHLTSVYLSPLAPGESLSDLVEIVAHLRAPEGCPWDREQTLATLRKDLLSEAAEVAEAVDADVAAEESGEEDAATTGDITEELGDLLLVALMMVQIAAEEGRFQLADVTRGIVEKLIRRHPHVFGEVVAENTGEVLANWEEIKRAEKAAKGIVPHPLDGVPQALGALEKARQLQSKARKVKLLDRAALAGKNAEVAALLAKVDSEEALGELLWQITAHAAEQDLNAEDALRTKLAAFRAAQSVPAPESAGVVS